MAVKDYTDPRWQKLRLEIMNRDKFTCQCCGTSEIELQVHHLAYGKGKRIWEAMPSDLLTLCRDCHEQTEMYVTLMRRHGPRLIKQRRAGGDDLARIVRALLEAGE
jgi:5-methylcytosine-specific restriction endonuclease McrA